MQSASALINSSSGIVLKMMKLPTSESECLENGASTSVVESGDDLESQRNILQTNDDNYTKAKIVHRQKGASQHRQSRTSQCLALISSTLVTLAFFFYVIFRDGKSEDFSKFLYDLKNVSGNVVDVNAVHNVVK